MILQMDAQGRGQRHPSPAGSAWLMLGGRSPASILPPAEGWICPSLLGLWMSGPAKKKSLKDHTEQSPGRQAFSGVCPKSYLGQWGFFSGQRNLFLQEISTSWISPLQRWKKVSNAGADTCTKLLQNQYMEENNALSLYFSRASHPFQAPMATYIFLPALKLLSPLTCPEQLLGQAHFQISGSILPPAEGCGLSMSTLEDGNRD